MDIETAVIPLAGAGTRVFPATTAIDKSMMPIYAGNESRPLVDFMIEECALAGLRRIIFVTSDRGKTQLQEYLGELNPNLKELLKTAGKSEKIEEELARRAQYDLAYEYIIQPPDRYGTAVPLHLARTALSGEQAFALMGGDDFVYHTDGVSELNLAIKTWQSNKTDHTIMASPVEPSLATNYGILRVENDKLLSIDEKPPAERVPSNPLANISRYLLSHTIWAHVEEEMTKDRSGGEHCIVYVINSALEAGQTFGVHTISGTYLDGGSPAGLRYASNYITSHPSKCNQ